MHMKVAHTETDALGQCWTELFGYKGTSHRDPERGGSERCEEDLVCLRGVSLEQCYPRTICLSAAPEMNNR